jgi:hypothetical protein
MTPSLPVGLHYLKHAFGDERRAGGGEVRGKSVLLMLHRLRVFPVFPTPFSARPDLRGAIAQAAGEIVVVTPRAVRICASAEGRPCRRRNKSLESTHCTGIRSPEDAKEERIPSVAEAMVDDRACHRPSEIGRSTFYSISNNDCQLVIKINRIQRTNCWTYPSRQKHRRRFKKYLFICLSLFY